MRSSLLSKDFPRPALKSSIPSATSDTNSHSKSRGRVSVFDVSILEASIRLILGLRSYLSFAICIFRSYSSTQGKPAALLATVCFSPPVFLARQRDPAPPRRGQPAFPRRLGDLGGASHLGAGTTRSAPGMALRYPIDPIIAAAPSVTRERGTGWRVTELSFLLRRGELLSHREDGPRGDHRRVTPRHLSHRRGERRMRMPSAGELKMAGE
jgi:hypothetical protein